MPIFEGSSILITGGTGSFGKAFLRQMLETRNPNKVIVFSRDELKQYEMKQTYGDDPRVRFFLGDIRDRDRLRMALHGVDYVVHAAALKQVDTAEYNPMEYVKTNILGSENVMLASMDAGVKKVVALSTDKASSPVNLYGATKLTADKLFISSNHYAHNYGTSYAVVRYGNVMGSRGSVIPFFRGLAQRGEPLPITDFRMTRFWITLPQAVEFVLRSFQTMQGGELYVPRIPSMRVVDLAEAIAPGSELVEVGIRPGEKLHEEMISAEDSRRTIRQADRYVVMPTLAEWGFSEPEGEAVLDGFSYTSDTNDLWLSVDDLRRMLDELDL
ncbi:MAG: UDP-N-acetylglucosamine 4,6-dehydratase (inverting) [Actinomycetales bacterium]|nr:UDP-N-acetylglucosamine 4,6-dehydratase (inverting) [Actinomycetales bacterium]